MCSLVVSPSSSYCAAIKAKPRENFAACSGPMVQARLIASAHMPCAMASIASTVPSFMGLSLRLGGWGQSRHFTGLDRPALIQQVGEGAKGDGVDVFHASIKKNFAKFEMATDGKTSCHHFPETD